MASDTDVERSRAYVRSLSDQCAYDDGYRCRPGEPPVFEGWEADQRLLPGRYLAAWQISYEDFRQLEDLTAEQKDLKHYRIGFGEENDAIVVLYRALLMPRIEQGQPTEIMRVTFGQSIKYWVNIETGTVVKRLLLK
jgi:hypothetical protein